ncbi:MAG: TonB family protein [Fibromonadales bacterium]|nr:TonB family protein [Fibromonadales bacterium]
MKLLLILLILWSLCFPKEDAKKNSASDSEMLSGLTGGSYKSRPAVKSIKDRFPETVFEIQEATGSYSKEEVKAVIDNGMLGLRSIYYKHLAKGPDFDGSVLLKFTIAKNGEIAEVNVVHSSTGNVEFDEAVKNRIASWKWNAKNGNTSVAILIKFTVLLRTHSSGRISLLISGMRSFKDIYPTLISQTPGLSGSIRNRRLRLEPDLNGDIILIFKFEVDKNGEVTNIDIVVNTAEYFEFDEVIRSNVAKWKFKPIENGNTTVSAFYVFDKPKPK